MTYFVTGLTDGTDEPDYAEQIPDIDPFSFEFRDGSRITLVDFDYPIVTGNSRSDARAVADWIEHEEADNESAIEYITKNYLR